MKNKKINQLGRSMIEVLAVIGLIGFIAAGVVTGVNNGLISATAARYVMQVNTIGMEVSELCSWVPNDGACSFDKDRDLNYAPDDWSISVSSITVPDVSLRVCRRMLNPDYNSIEAGLFYDVKHGGSSWVEIENGNDDFDTSDDPLWATSCDSSGGSMIFSFVDQSNE